MSRDERGEDVTNRLSKRFGEESESSKSEKASKIDKTDKRDMKSETGKSSSTGKSVESSENVRDRPSVLMYLPEDLRQELDLRFDELNLQYKREHGEALGKNKDYYPAVVEAALEGKDIEEVLEMNETDG